MAKTRAPQRHRNEAAMGSLENDLYQSSSSKEEGCIFCQKMREDDAREALVLAHTGHSVVMLNKYPYANGHLLLAPKRHEKHLSSLSVEEYRDLNEALRRSVDIVRQSYNPAGINLGMNLGKCAGAGIEDHLHWHIVPRWEGDNEFYARHSEKPG